jgi:hypothetical protein
MATTVEIRHTAENSPYGKSRKQNVTARAKRAVSFCAICSEDCRASSQLLRDDLVSAPAEVHEMVAVNRFLDGIKNVRKENKIAAPERASRSFVVVLA